MLILPGSEIVLLSNNSFTDFDMSGGTIVVGDSVFQFDDGYNFARGTTIEGECVSVGGSGCSNFFFFF